MSQRNKQKAKNRTKSKAAQTEQTSNIFTSNEMCTFCAEWKRKKTVNALCWLFRLPLRFICVRMSQRRQCLSHARETQSLLWNVHALVFFGLFNGHRHYCAAVLSSIGWAAYASIVLSTVFGVSRIWSRICWNMSIMERRKFSRCWLKQSVCAAGSCRVFNYQSSQLGGRKRAQLFFADRTSVHWTPAARPGVILRMCFVFVEYKLPHISFIFFEIMPSYWLLN